MYIKPTYPERADPRALSVNGLTLKFLAEHGVPSEKAAELLFAWWQKECKGEQLEPVGQNWPFDRGFLMAWLGQEMFDKIFFRHYRDTCSAAKFINDRSALVDGKIVFDKFRLQNLCEKLGIKYEKGHDAYHDCIMTLEVYRQLLLKPIV